jgi:hypothetical protein
MKVKELMKWLALMGEELEIKLPAHDVHGLNVRSVSYVAEAEVELRSELLKPLQEELPKQRVVIISAPRLDTVRESEEE